MIKNNVINNDCTIIVPTYNRPAYLKRILTYYDYLKVGCNVIVADSSSDGNKMLNEGIISSFSNINISHLDNYSSNKLLFYKIVDVINYVDTKCCAICADDDFITPNGIKQSIDFLENNQDYSVAHGVYVKFSIKKNSENKPYLLWKLGYHPESITFSEANDRLYHHLANYSFPTFYGVHRTTDLKMILDETAKYTDDVRFGELLPTLLTAIHGKIKCLDVLYAARDASSGSNVYPNLYDYMKDGTYDAKYSRFKNCLVNHLVKESNLEIGGAEEIIDNAMPVYLKNNCGIKNRFSFKMSSFLDILKLPDSIDSKIRSTYRKIVFNEQKNKSLLGNNVDSRFNDELNKIQMICTMKQ